jgi:uncharacterized coiled-coil protein SlyX
MNETLGTCLHGVPIKFKCNICHPQYAQTYESVSLTDLVKRIEKLESHYYSDGDLSAIHGHIDNLYKNSDFQEQQIEELEKDVAYNRCKSEKEDERLQERIEALEKNKSEFVELHVNDFLRLENDIIKLEKSHEDQIEYCQSVMGDCANQVEDLQKERDLGVERLKRLEQYMEMEDRITAGSVLNRIFLLEEHHNYQIDENRKISRRVDELEKLVIFYEKCVSDLNDRLWDRVHNIESKLDIQVNQLEPDLSINQKPKKKMWLAYFIDEKKQDAYLTSNLRSSKEDMDSYIKTGWKIIEIEIDDES